MLMSDKINFLIFFFVYLQQSRGAQYRNGMSPTAQQPGPPSNWQLRNALQGARFSHPAAYGSYQQPNVSIYH